MICVVSQPACDKSQDFSSGGFSRGLEPNDWKPMPAVGLGVREIRIHTTLEHRVLYIAKFDDAVYVLHAFQKRTQRTPKRDVELARQRLGEAMRRRHYRRR